MEYYSCYRFLLLGSLVYHSYISSVVTCDTRKRFDGWWM